jgi:hypothetical protein
MRAMLAPLTGIADAWETKVNETADAATMANKVIFIVSSLMMCERPNTGRTNMAPAAPRTGTVRLRATTGSAHAKMGTALGSGAHTVICNLRLETYRKSSAEQVAFI